MTDADRALAQIKAALDAGPTPGPWDAFHKHKYDEWHVSVPLPRGTMRLALFTDGCPTERPQADAEYIAACNPSNMRAIVAHIDAQAAEIERLRAELERERMRLAACGVVALANTPESAKKARDMHPDYRSASCDDVARMVDKQMALRAAVEALVPIVQRDRELIGECDEYRAERDAALRLADEAMGEGK